MQSDWAEMFNFSIWWYWFGKLMEMIAFNVQIAILYAKQLAIAL